MLILVDILRKDEHLDSMMEYTCNLSDLSFVVQDTNTKEFSDIYGEEIISKSILGVHVVNSVTIVASPVVYLIKWTLEEFRFIWDSEFKYINNFYSRDIRHMVYMGNKKYESYSLSVIDIENLQDGYYYRIRSGEDNKVYYCNIAYLLMRVLGYVIEDSDLTLDVALESNYLTICARNTSATYTGISYTLPDDYEVNLARLVLLGKVVFKS